MAYKKVYTNPNMVRSTIIGDIDYVQDDKVIVGEKPSSIMVSDENDLDELEGYVPGSVAFTAGFAEMWQLDADGNWVALGGE